MNKRNFRDLKWWIEDNYEDILAAYIVILVVAVPTTLLILSFEYHYVLLFILPFIPFYYAIRCYVKEDLRNVIEDRATERKKLNRKEIIRLKKLLLAKSKMVNIDLL